MYLRTACMSMAQVSICSKPRTLRTEWEIDVVARDMHGLLFFQQFASDQLRRVAAHISFERAEKAAVMYQQGESGSIFYVIFQGSVTLHDKRNRVGSERDDDSTDEDDGNDSDSSHESAKAVQRNNELYGRSVAELWHCKFFLPTSPSGEYSRACRWTMYYCKYLCSVVLLRSMNTLSGNATQDKT